MSCASSGISLSAVNSCDPVQSDNWDDRSLAALHPAFCHDRRRSEPATYTLLIALYQYAWQRFLMGYASAIAWLIFVISLIVSLVILRWSQSWVYYAGDVRGRR